MSRAVAAARCAQAAEQLDPDRSRPVEPPDSARAIANIRAARMGPTVWELEGPMPILNRSKTLIAMAGLPP